MPRAMYQYYISVAVRLWSEKAHIGTADFSSVFLSIFFFHCVFHRKIRWNHASTYHALSTYLLLVPVYLET